MHQLPLAARVLTIGSCFSDTIGGRLADAKVSALVNPFGTVFNPVAACKLLRAAAGEEADWQQHLVEARGRWQSYDLHATLGADSPVELLQTLQQLLRDTGVFLATADVVILTLGTAWAYRLLETDELVSNCHKMPAEKFSKELLTPDEIINAVAETHAYLRQRNPKLRFVLTVSPVRHLKDTLPLNAVSKSVLRVACHYLSELLPDVSYFPAYELLLDDLRDYRFYAADMLHPSAVAEDYIWERFAQTYFDGEFGRFRKEWEAVRQALSHRPLHPAAPEHRQFLTGTLERLEKLATQADMRMEILEIRKQLQNLPVPKPQPAPALVEEDDEERIDIGAESVALPAAAPKREISLEPVPVTTGTEPALAASSNEAESLAETMEEAGLPKKKRRSRGGAKRNKKKHAARLAEEAATLTDDPAELLPEILGAAEPATGYLPAADLATAADNTLDFDPNAPLQTAMERRKRASRRGRGNKQPNEPVVEMAGGNDLPTAGATEPITPVATTEPEATTATLPAPDVSGAETASAEPADLAGAAGPQRLVRTGRSASEVRAAALRKPRRPDSRIKTLYATAPENLFDPAQTPGQSTPETPLETAAAAPIATNLTSPITSAAEVPVRDPIPAAPVAAELASRSLVSAIPVVKGTGASGRLSTAGKATLNPAPVRSEPAAAVRKPVKAKMPLRPKPDTAAGVIKPLGQVTLPAVPAIAETAPESATAPPAVVLAAPAAPAPRQPRRKPAGSATGKAAAPAAQPAAVKPKAARPAAKSAKKAVVPAETPVPTEAVAPSPAPAVRRRKPAAKPAAPAPELPPAAPKRAPRPSRRKPAAPDEPTEAS
ncbi:MAG: GSCFA domain-containing protein [Hymenobacter sp.]|nr:GSCFA domain-containing protein [Hymenobacter sp.]